MRRVLFVCTGNTCRSVIAEYLARHRLDPTFVRCESAGLRLVPSEDARNAVETLKRNFGINASAHISRALVQVDLTAFDLIVAIDDPGGNQVHKTLKERGVSDKTLVKWKVTDPWNGDDPSQYDRCALETVKNLEGLKKTIALA